MLPHVRFTLIDSIKKKTEVLKTIIEELKLNNCEVICIRSEDLSRKFDLIIGRAVSNLNDFIKSTKHLVKNNEIENRILKPGIIYLKGGQIDEELKLIRHKTKVFNIYEKIQEDYFKEKYILYITF